MSKTNTTKNQVCLIVLDGWGYREDKKNNAIAAAKTPYFDSIWKKYPHSLLEASGLFVGLPDGQMGNSEIGHTTIGAGKVIDTDLIRIKKAIDNGDFAKNPAFTALFDHIKKYDSTLHVQGLIGTGGVHAHSDHLFAFLRAAKAAGIKRVAIHAFTDGRDTPPQSAAQFMRDLETELEKIGIGFIATFAGRFYAMDRDNNWNRLAKFEQALFECKGNVCEIKASDMIDNLYKEGKLDEHLEPVVCLIDDKGKTASASTGGKGCKVEDNDGVFFFNFRADRARMLSTKILEKQAHNNVCFVTLTEYFAEHGEEKKFKSLVAFPPINIETTLAAEISRAGLKQAHIAETEKFPHATYFLNGGVEDPYPGESHIMLDSRKDVNTHDLAPKMRAEGIADKAIEQINAGVDFIFINFANADMVGHTANVPAIIEGVEEVDKQLKRVCEAMLARSNTQAEKSDAATAPAEFIFVTADHGNAETNIDATTGEKHTSHTTNPVPAILVQSSNVEGKYCTGLSNGGLSDITPTILKLLAVPQPASMTGKSLLLSGIC